MAGFADLEPSILVIFGITGDLAKRHLLPSLYHLTSMGVLNDKTEVVGITRGETTLDELLDKIELCVSEVDGICKPEVVEKLKQRLQIRQMDLDSSADYKALNDHLDELETKHGVSMNRLYYLSVPPKVAQPIIHLIGQNGLNSTKENTRLPRLLLEKPFGFNLSSAHDLINKTAEFFSEEQIYRIDHYLAKETVQNILQFRFNNPIFEPLWDKDHVDYIEVVAEEALGIENRVDFYEQTGALRDLLQSHLLQILGLVTMEQPTELTAEKIHRHKLTVMEEFMPVGAGAWVRGQYKSYKDEVANPNSTTETFAAVKLLIDNHRWHNVPMIVKTGKSLPAKTSAVNVVFKPTEDSPHHNVLTFNIQPNEGIELSLRVKKPGFNDVIQPVEMDFKYQSNFAPGQTPTAYERVLVDAIRGDHTLFATAQEIIESWRVVEDMFENWQKDVGDIVIYDNNSSGPDVSKLYPLE